jgi:large subunit ribosomal protein L21
MYAIIAEDGRQLKVHEGDTLQIDYRGGETGDELKFEKVLAAGGEGGLKLGKPTLSGASVTVQILEVVQGPKLVVQKMRRRKNLRRRNGHRQMYTTVKVTKISVP